MDIINLYIFEISSVVSNWVPDWHFPYPIRNKPYLSTAADGCSNSLITNSYFTALLSS